MEKTISDRIYRAVYAAILLLSVVTMVYFKLIDGYCYVFDAASFRVAADRLSLGYFDAFRTPVYPAIIVAMRTILPPQYVYPGLCVVQAAVFLLSAEVLRRLFIRMGLRRWLGLLLVAVYADSPGVTEFSVIPISDSLGVSFMVFWLWSMLRDDATQARASSAVMSVVILGLMVFLRPVFVCLLPLSALWWGHVWLRRRRRGLSARPALAGIIGLVVLSGLLESYREEIHRLYGLTSFSHVSSINNFCTVAESGNLKPEDCRTPAQREILEYFKATGDTVRRTPIFITVNLKFHTHIPPHELEGLCNTAIRNHPGGIARAIAYRTTHKAWNDRAMHTLEVSPWLSVYRTYMPRMCWVMILYALGAIVLAVLSLSRRRAGAPQPARSWLFWLAGAAILFTSLVGAMNDWSRLILPALPASLFILGFIISSFHFKKSRNDENQL